MFSFIFSSGVTEILSVGLGCGGGGGGGGALAYVMIRGCAIILGTFLGVLQDLWLSFWIVPGFLSIIFW